MEDVSVLSGVVGSVVVIAEVWNRGRKIYHKRHAHGILIPTTPPLLTTRIARLKHGLDFHQCKPPLPTHVTLTYRD